MNLYVTFNVPFVVVDCGNAFSHTIIYFFQCDEILFFFFFVLLLSKCLVLLVSNSGNNGVSASCVLGNRACFLKFPH